VFFSGRFARAWGVDSRPGKVLHVCIVILDECFVCRGDIAVVSAALRKKLRKYPIKLPHLKYPIKKICIKNTPIVGDFNGSVVYFNAGIGLTFLGRSCSTRQELYFQLFFKSILAVGCR
jgi:hypothetical protein